MVGDFWEMLFGSKKRLSVVVDYWEYIRCCIGCAWYNEGRSV